MKLRPMLQVSDVEASSRWYQNVLGLTSGHGGAEFEMLMHGHEHLINLHRLDAHEHGFATLESGTMRGAGVSLWFETSDREAFESLSTRAAESGATMLEAAHWNPQAHHYEATFRDLDGYVVAIHSPFELTDTDQRP